MHEIPLVFVAIIVHLLVVGCTISITKFPLDIPRHRNCSPCLFRAVIKYCDGIHSIAAVAGGTSIADKKHRIAAI